MERTDSLQSNIVRDLRALLEQDTTQPPERGRFSGEERLALEQALRDATAGHWDAAHAAVLALSRGVTHRPYRIALSSVMTDLSECARLHGIDILV